MSDFKSLPFPGVSIQGDHWLLEELIAFLVSCQENPIVVLTAALVVINAIYMILMARSVRILAMQFLANIEPQVSVMFRKHERVGNTFTSHAYIETEGKPAIIRSGFLQVTCQHGHQGAASNLEKHQGASLRPGESAIVPLNGAFTHLTDPLACHHELEGYVVYSDSRGLGKYTLIIERDGYTRRIQHPIGAFSKKTLWFRMKLLRLRFWLQTRRKKKG